MTPQRSARCARRLVGLLSGVLAATALVSAQRAPGSDRQIGGPSGGGQVAAAMSVRQLILNSYELFAPQLVGGPSWLDDAVPVRLSLDGPPSPDRIRAAMRTLLVDRFKLVMHPETREIEVFALMPIAPGARPGTAIKATSVADCRSEPPAGPPPCGAIRLDEGQLVGRAATMAQFVQMLNRIPVMTKLDRLVVDRSAYAGTYTFDWQFVVASRPDRAELRQALELAFRLKLEPLRAPVEVMVIDRIERPLD